MAKMSERHTKILELLTENDKVEVTKLSELLQVSQDVYKRQPLGDPIEVNVRGYELSLRKADAAMIEVQ